MLIGETEATAAGERSVTLAGDTAQRLFLDNGFADWRTVLEQLDLQHVAVEPLRIAYRSTREILALARHAMGPLAEAEPPQAPRSGAPVEAHRFPGDRRRGGVPGRGAAPAVRSASRGPRWRCWPATPSRPTATSTACAGPRSPALRRVRAQEFAFRPGVEVTDIRQVKGLEFDYVVMVDANAAPSAPTTSPATCSTSPPPAPPTSCGWCAPPRPAR